MQFLIIESHPYRESFNTNAAAMIRKVLTGKGHTVETIDLINDKFDPVMYTDDLKLWSKGKTTDKLVEKYKKMITNADMLVILFPVWWGNMPAILKGFWDKVLLPGWAYTLAEDGSLSGLITGKKAVVITTMSVPSVFFNDYLQNPVRGAFIKNTLEVCGFEVSKHFEIEKIDSGREYTEEKMREIERFFAIVSN
ncbi:MAG: NAD(P)H-dependent oxidoreductase [Treponema sp.]|jgi:putative NADPH-quinone reductase|nr:NAD(P)H-dependent oxidoreductase [Treponema sp.]